MQKGMRKEKGLTWPSPAGCWDGVFSQHPKGGGFTNPLFLYLRLLLPSHWDGTWYITLSKPRETGRLSVISLCTFCTLMFMKYFLSYTVSHLILICMWCDCEYYFVVPIFQNRKLSYREVTWLDQVSNIASIWPRQESLWQSISLKPTGLWMVGWKQAPSALIRHRILF